MRKFLVVSSLLLSSLVTVLSEERPSILNSDVVTETKRNVRSLATRLQVKKQYDVTWNLDRLASPYGDKKYKWKYDGTGVTVFVFGSGIRTTHEEFGGRASCGYSVLGDECQDRSGTGTSIAGIVGGSRYGVAKNVTLKAVKVVNATGEYEITNILNGVQYILQERIVNPTTPMIVVTGQIAYTDEQGLRIAKTLTDQNIVVVAGSGASSEDACTTIPQAAPSCITVAPMNRKNYRTTQSNYGQCVDLLAPGENIRTASNKTDINTVILNSSLLAGAHVAGVAAMYLEKNPTWNAVKVGTIIKRDSIPNIIKFPNSKFTPNLLVTTNYITNN